METSFSDWLANELSQRNMTQAELAKISGVTPAQISRIISGQRGAGEDALKAIAHALRYPAEVVFRAAGLLPPAPEIQTEDQQFLYLLHLMDELSREELLEFMKFKLEHKAANKATSRGKKPARSALI
jgi:transcriptional regulator with XRE-family HTH domain